MASLETGAGGSNLQSPNMARLETGAGGSNLQSRYGERFTRGSPSYILHASGSRSEPVGFSPTLTRQRRSEFQDYQIGQIDGRKPHKLAFDRELGPYRYEVHSLRCLDSYGWDSAQGMTIPSWARWDNGRPYDVLVAMGMGQITCWCTFDYLTADVNTGHIRMMSSAVRNGRFATDLI